MRMVVVLAMGPRRSVLRYYIAMNVTQIIRIAAAHRSPQRGDRPRGGVVCLAIVLVGFAVVLLRYVFGIGSIWLTETILYAHAALFLLAAAWTLREGGHVRVDMFYARRVVARWIDLVGALVLLLPFCSCCLVRAAVRRALLGHPRTLARD